MSGDPGAAPPPAVLPPLVVDRVRWPVMVQHWSDVVFLHWAYDPAAVQRLLPDGVHVDVHDGSAWVALVPFRMERLGLPGLGPLPLVSTFPEVNVRTYVWSGRRRGVWFFSLDIDRMLPTIVARTAYALPYCAGRVEHLRVADVVATRVERRWPRPAPTAHAEIVVRIGDEVAPDETDHFLTSRWGLVSAGRRGRLRHAAVDHPPWPLHRADLEHLEESLLIAAGLPAPVGVPRVLWSPGVDVRVGPPRSLPSP